MTHLTTFTVMKNEGPYLLEWVAYQKVFGARDILVMSNHCVDATVPMLMRLEEMGVVRHVPNPSQVSLFHGRGGERHHIAGRRYAELFPEWRRADYILMCDTDEFPVTFSGDGDVAALIEAAGAADVISLAEIVFGAGTFDLDRPVMERMDRCSSLTPGKWRARKGVKSFCRRLDGLDIRNHRPVADPDIADRLNWVDGSGAQVPAEFRTEHIQGVDCRGRYELGGLYHAPLKSAEEYILKAARGDAVMVERDRFTLKYWRSRNRQESSDTRIAPLRAKALKLRADWLTDPVLARHHRASIATHTSMLAALLEQPNWAALHDEITQAAG
ncbi:MAG: glycosyltransferase family 2 protein [Pseudomonadota bacterium]